MSASELFQRVESVGGALWLVGESLGYHLPESESLLVDELRTMKWELVDLLRQRPTTPPGVTLVRWNPIPAPVRLNRCVVVIDTHRFIEAKLRELAASLRGDQWGAGNWSCSELRSHLESVGVVVE